MAPFLPSLGNNQRRECPRRIISTLHFLLFLVLSFTPHCISFQSATLLARVVKTHKEQHVVFFIASSPTTTRQRRRTAREYQSRLKNSNDNDNERASRLSSSSSSSSSRSSSSSSTSSYLATCIPGLAGTLAQELLELGCRNIEIKGTSQSAVSFSADLRTALSVLLWTRTALKVMEFLCSSSFDNDNDIHNRNDLFQFIKNSVDCKDLLGDGKGNLLTLSVAQVILNNPRSIPSDINHSHFTALTVKNAICDAVRDLRPHGDRPNVDLDDPDVPLVVILHGTTGSGSGESTAQVSLYRQLHVGSLHRRGYRQGVAIHKAALKESLAAGLLQLAEWPQQVERVRDENNENDTSNPLVLLDPMAGSGTFLLEAVMMAADMAPGLMRIKCGVPGHRIPAVVRWKHADDDTDAYQVWKDLLWQATSRTQQGLQWLRSNNHMIQFLGNDAHPGALELLERALEQSGLEGLIQIHEGDCRDWQPAITTTIDKNKKNDASWFVVCNPPWGERLNNDNSNNNNNDGDDQEEYVEEAWESLRAFLRETCPGAKTTAWILSGNASATKHLGLRKSASHPIKTGPQDLRWLQYLIRDKQQLQLSSEKVNVNNNNNNNNHHVDSNDDDKEVKRQYRPPVAAARQWENNMVSPTTRNQFTRDGDRNRRTSTTTTKSSRTKARRAKASRTKVDTNEWLI